MTVGAGHGDVQRGITAGVGAVEPMAERRPEAIVEGMHCPFCQNPDTKVVDTRLSEDGHTIRRRRECPQCGRRFTTVESTMLLVLKRSGNVEPFDRAKVIAGVRKACQGRPIDEGDLKALGQKVEEDLRSRGLAQVRSEDVGKAILRPLRDLDEVAYLRFASVYRNFGDLEDFQYAIACPLPDRATQEAKRQAAQKGIGATPYSAVSVGPSRA